jgi:hypothetical protein
MNTHGSYRGWAMRQGISLSRPVHQGQSHRQLQVATAASRLWLANTATPLSYYEQIKN